VVVVRALSGEGLMQRFDALFYLEGFRAWTLERHAWCGTIMARRREVGLDCRQQKSRPLGPERERKQVGLWSFHLVFGHPTSRWSLGLCFLVPRLPCVILRQHTLEPKAWAQQ